MENDQRGREVRIVLAGMGAGTDNRGMNRTANALTAKRRPWWRRLLRICGRLMLAFVVLSVALVVLFRFAPVPISGVMIERQISAWLRDDGRYQARQQWVPMPAISAAMPLAVMAGEDQRFPDHYGFDWQQMQRAWEAHGRGKRLRGASTLSQQVAKNLFLWSGRSYVRKGLEAWFTVLIEALWSKSRILEVHMNIVEFGPGVFGVEAASQTFFRVPARTLSRSQAALLAAVLPNPHRFRVAAPSAYVVKRQQWILRQMRQLGDVSALNRL